MLLHSEITQIEGALEVEYSVTQTEVCDLEGKLPTLFGGWGYYLNC